MKKLLLSGAALLALATSEKAGAQAWSQDFNSGFPANWTMINDGHYVIANDPFETKLQTQAWATFARSTTDSSMGTTSLFWPLAKADRWIITHAFTVGAGMSLAWEDYASYLPDSLQILVSPTAGTTAASFTTTIYNDRADTVDYKAHTLSLSAYAGQTIRLAFRENSTSQFYLYVDNIAVKVIPAVDAMLTGLTPASGLPFAYGLPGTSITMTGTVTNHGSNALTAYNLKYRVNGGPVITQAMTGNIPFYGSAPVTFNTPYTIPATGAYNVKAWVEAGGDANHSNDSVTTTFTGVAYMPKKRLMIEEATRTTCGWCVRGLVYMDSMRKAHPGDISLVAVHSLTNDPMTIPAYDDKVIQRPDFPGEPSILIDRREISDPYYIFNVWNAQHNIFGFADMTMATPTWNGNTLTVPVTVKPAINLSGDYRLALVLTEDRVHSNAGGYWDQGNDYSFQSQNLPLSNSEYNFQQLPWMVPSSLMYYDLVARSISNVSGDPGSLPASMTAGTTYSKTYTVAVNPAWVHSNIHAVVMLIRNSDGVVLNSVNSSGTLAVTNVSAGISELSVFPNPAAGNASARIGLSQAAGVAIEVVDVTGRVVIAIPAVRMDAGEHIVTLPVAGLAPGVYNVKVTTEGGVLTERLAIVK